jgi:hypothetical protein
MNAHLLTSAEAADYLKVAKQTLAVWRLKGIGPAFVKVGRKVTYDRAMLEAYLAARTFASTSEY